MQFICVSTPSCRLSRFPTLEVLLLAAGNKTSSSATNRSAVPLHALNVRSLTLSYLLLLLFSPPCHDACLVLIVTYHHNGRKFCANLLLNTATPSTAIASHRVWANRFSRDLVIIFMHHCVICFLVFCLAISPPQQQAEVRPRGPRGIS